MKMIDLDKKFIQKVLHIGGVEKDVLVKRYEKYIWGIIHKRVSGDSLPAFLKNDLFQYVFIKLFEEDARALRQYISGYDIPFQNYLSLFVSSRLTDYIRKEVKETSREVVIVGAEGENLAYEAALSEAPENAQVLETMEFGVMVENFIQGLPAKEQDVFRLMSEGVSSGEIAGELGLDIKQVYKLNSNHLC
jgi:RNA polymerase sigma factor (sigma-70 family)